MILFDCRPGITFSLLVAVTGKTLADSIPLLNSKAHAFAPPHVSFDQISAMLEKALRCSTIEAVVASLRSSCSRLPALSVSQAGNITWEEGEKAKEIIHGPGIDSLDPFEFSAYILLTILLRCHESNPGLFTPCIGSDADDQVFSILKNTCITVSPAAPAISPFCAAVLSGYFTPFYTQNPPGVLERMESIGDPLDAAAQAHVFQFRETAPETDRIMVLQANIDDMSPEILAHACRVIMEKGALDVTVIPALMKKGRPGYLLEALVRPGDYSRMEEIILRHTSTFGVRSYACSRRVLDRQQEYFSSSFGRIRIKRGYFQGECVRNVPEYEDLNAISQKTGIPLVRLCTDIQKEIARNELKNIHPGKEIM